MRHLAFPRQTGMGAEMPVFAMHGDGDMRPYPLIHLGQFIAVGVTGCMNIRIPRGNDPYAQFSEPVLQLTDTDFVAGNFTAGKNHRIAVAERHSRVILPRDAGQRCARFALASGADQQHLFRRQSGRRVIVKKRWQVLQIPGRFGGLYHAVQ